MTKGILVFAFNNARIDYISQAVDLAKRAKRHLNLPVSIVTDQNIKNSEFDNIIFYKLNTNNKKKYYNGIFDSKSLHFKNDARIHAYQLTPYEETLVLDTDLVIADANLNRCFDSLHDFLILKNSKDMAGFRDTKEFDYISETGVEFYWATVVFFRKTKCNQIFFDLINHIYENWTHYKQLYQISSSTYRNDFAFSIAIHIMNGFNTGNYANPVPGSILYTTDKDILYNMDKDEFTFLLEKENRNGEYTFAKIKNQTVHVMNKFSLDKALKNE